MKLLIVRHGPAGDREEFAKTGKPDSLRPLTEEGREKMRKAAKGLARIAPAIELVATSPLVRARQTAELVWKAVGTPEICELRELTPNAEPESLLRWLGARREESLALVGHEPHLSRLIAYLCARRAEPLTELKKGQACLLELDKAAGRAKIEWSLAPAQLRRLAR